MMRKKKTKLIFSGSDDALDKLDCIDPVYRMSYQQKLTLIYQLTLFEYQFRNNTNDVPRFLRTTACIRKA